MTRALDRFVVAFWLATSCVPGIVLTSCGASVDASAECTLSGRVVLAGATDVAGLAVAVIGPTSAGAVTDGTGVFTIEHLPPGRYAISVTAISTAEGSRATVVDLGSGTTTLPDFVFTPLGEVTGKVTFGTPTGNAGITVIAGTSGSGVTDDGGTYVIRNVPVGAQDVVAAFPGWPGGFLKGVPIEYRKRATAPELVLVRGAVGTGIIRGTVSIAGEAAHDGVTVVATGAEGASGAVSDATGAWTIAGLAAGTYSLTVSAPSTVEGARTLSVVVESGKPITLEPMAFTPLGTLRGKVTLGGKTTGNAGIMVWVDDVPITLTDDAGNWELRGARTGTSTIRASMEGWKLTSIAGPKLGWRGVASADLIDLAAEPLMLTTISGDVVFPDRTDHEGIVVSLSGSPTTTTTDSKGHYSLVVGGSGVRTLTFASKDGRWNSRIDDVLLLPGGTAFIRVSGTTLRPIPLAKMVRGKFLGRGQYLGRTPGGEMVIWGSGSQVDLVSTTGGTTTLAPKGTAVGWVTLSPDGRYVTYSNGTPKVVPTGTGLATTLPTDAKDFRFLAGGKSLVFHVDQALSALTLETGKITPLGNITVPTYGDGCVPAPDGLFIACLSTTPPPTGLGLMVRLARVDGTAINEVPGRFLIDFPASWAAGGRWLQPTYATGGNGLELVTVGSTPTVRTLFTNFVRRFIVSPDGRWALVFRVESGVYSTWLVDLSTTDPPMKLAESVEEVGAAFSPDSASVSWLGSPGLHTAKLAALSSVVASTAAGAGSLSYLDSSTVVLTSIRGGGLSPDNGSLFVVSAAGGTPVTLTDRLMTDSSQLYVASPDATKLVFRYTRTDGARALAQATASGTVTPLLAGTAFEPVWSVDGARIATRLCSGSSGCWPAVVGAAGSSAPTAIGWQNTVIWHSATEAVLVQSTKYGESADDALWLATLP